MINADIVTDPDRMNEVVAKHISAALDFAADNNRRTADSMDLRFFPALKNYYAAVEFKPLWSDKEKWKPSADSVINFFSRAMDYGLFQKDYCIEKLRSAKLAVEADSALRKDAVRWANADVAFTHEFIHLIRDLHFGRLQADSTFWKTDSAQLNALFTGSLEQIRIGTSFAEIIENAEPQNDNYRALRKSISSFTDSMDTKQYSFVSFPYKDTIAFRKSLKKRLAEAGITSGEVTDSISFSAAIKKYQQRNGLAPDGKPGPELVKQLNNTDHEKFNRIAVTLDRYKLLIEKMPEKFIWVNLPGFYLKVLDHDTVALESKIICGKPATPTPFLTSEITDIVIFPTWTVPSSIISKEMLPGLKRNPNYLSRKGLYLLNGKGERIDPAAVNWSKYSKGIPYRIQQGSGDDNALGVIKFNFNNPFSVYLHDTNQRYLFKNAFRSLSHGCVRVQEWEKLAGILVRNDSALAKRTDTLRYNTDSIANWISNKERHRIDLRHRYPLFIKYFTCEGIDGKIKFYDDIYGDDRALAARYFK